MGSEGLSWTEGRGKGIGVCPVQALFRCDARCVKRSMNLICRISCVLLSVNSPPSILCHPLAAHGIISSLPAASGRIAVDIMTVEILLRGSDSAAPPIKLEQWGLKIDRNVLGAARSQHPSAQAAHAHMHRPAGYARPQSPLSHTLARAHPHAHARTHTSSRAARDVFVDLSWRLFALQGVKSLPDSSSGRLLRS